MSSYNCKVEYFSSVNTDIEIKDFETIKNIFELPNCIFIFE